MSTYILLTSVVCAYKNLSSAAIHYSELEHQLVLPVLVTH